jgi:hypothetical protein
LGFRRGPADVGHLVDVVCPEGPKDLAGAAGEVAGELPKGGEVIKVVPVFVGPVGEAFGPEFETRKKTLNVGHT